MDLHTIIPVKPFGEAKQRLTPALNSRQRAQLAEDMFRHVVGVASAVFGAQNLIVISRSQEVLAIAKSESALAVPENNLSDLNSALLQAATFAETRGASKVLVLASDLPLLEADDLAELAKHACVIAPDRHCRGTNALLWPVTLPFAFGENSFARHLAIAANASLHPQTITRTGLAYDVDVLEDLIDTLPLSRNGRRRNP